MKKTIAGIILSCISLYLSAQNIRKPAEPGVLRRLSPEEIKTLAEKEKLLPSGPELKAMPGITFSDLLRVRTSPGLEAETVEKLPSLTPVLVYEISGTGKKKNGVLDRWLRIGDNRWINAYYVALFPFFTRSTGRIDSIKELTCDITDCRDIREIPFQQYWIDRKSGKVIFKPYEYGGDGYCFYGEPELPAAVDIRPVVCQEWLSLQMYATYGNFDDYYEDYMHSFPHSIANYYCFNKDKRDGGDLFFSMQEEGCSDDFYYEILGKNRVVLHSSGNTGRTYSFDVYIQDSRTMIFVVYGSKSKTLLWIRSGLDYYYEDFLKGKEKVSAITANDYGYQGDSLLIELINGYAKNPEDRIETLWPLAESCITYGCPVNYADYRGLTPLHYAAEHWDSGLIEYLVRNGGNTDFKDMDRKKPFDHVTEDHWPDNATSPEETKETLLKAMAGNTF